MAAKYNNERALLEEALKASQVESTPELETYPKETEEEELQGEEEEKSDEKATSPDSSPIEESKSEEQNVLINFYDET